MRFSEVLSHCLVSVGLSWLCQCVLAFQGPQATCIVSRPQPTPTFVIRRPLSSSTKLFRTPSKWDNIDEEDDEEDALRAPQDMKYVPRNVMRQHQNFVAIREAGGKEMTNDVYIPEADSNVFWFVGKVARVSDISVEQAVARQWPMIIHHAGQLRPIELFPGRAHLEIWVAPGDSELEVAYNRKDLVFQKMSREVEGAAQVKSNLIGFQGEVYDKEAGMGFRTLRNKADGTPAKPEIQTPAPDTEEEDEEYSEEKFRAPTDEELKKLQETLKEKKIKLSDLYEEQQKREGKSSQ